MVVEVYQNCWIKWLYAITVEFCVLEFCIEFKGWVDDCSIGSILYSLRKGPEILFYFYFTNNFPLQSGHYDAKDFLSYFYYGGMIYTALKNYNRALYFFEMVRSSVLKYKTYKSIFGSYSCLVVC